MFKPRFNRLALEVFAIICMAHLGFLQSAGADTQKICGPFQMQEQSAAVSEKFQEGFLWKVYREVTNLSYVLGSFHSDKGEIFDRWDPLVALLDDIKYFVAETSFEKDDAQAFAEKTLSSTPLSSLIGSEFFKFSMPIFESYGLAAQQVERLKPWAAFMQVAQPRGRIFAPDAHLYFQSVKRGITTIPLQGPEDLARSSESLSVDDQVEIFKETICGHAQILEQINRLKDWYLKDDVRGFLMESERLQPVHEETGTKFFKTFVEDRNKIFGPKVREVMGDGPTLVVVGAQHLYGTTGLLQDLSRSGFKVEPVNVAELTRQLREKMASSTTGVISELVTWLESSGVSVSANYHAPELHFAPTSKLPENRVAAKNGKIFISTANYHNVSERSPNFMVQILSKLVAEIHEAEMHYSNDNRCSEWNSKNVQNVILQQKYLTSRGRPSAGLEPPDLPQDCTL